MKRAYFDATAEIILEMFKKWSDLPEDTRILGVDANPPQNDGKRYQTNVVRFFVESTAFPDVPEGGASTFIMPMPKTDGEEHERDKETVEGDKGTLS